MSGGNIQLVKRGDALLGHDDAPRVTWKMAVIEELIVGQDSLTCVAVMIGQLVLSVDQSLDSTTY